MGGSHFFIYIGSYIILFICLFVALFLIFLWGGGHNFLHLLYSFVHHFPVEGEQFMQQYSKALSPTFRCQDSKACHRRFNAKCNVHSMNNIRAPETSLISVCHRIGFSADRVCSDLNCRQGLTAVEADSLYEGCILHRPQSCAFFYAIEHKHRERETIS